MGGGVMMVSLGTNRVCPCGSNLHRSELYDAKGYFCTFYCDECESVKRAMFKPAIFTDPNYYTEPGEDDPE
jgi:hypothetical protein